MKYLIFGLLFAGQSLLAQSDTLGADWSFGVRYGTALKLDPLERNGYNDAYYQQLHAECRLRPGFSWVFGVGISVQNSSRTGLDIFENPTTTQVNYTGRLRSRYFFAGPQFNWRSGQGDLSINLAPVIGSHRYRQTYDLARLEAIRASDGERVVGFQGFEMITYKAVYQLGGRAEASYNYWVSPKIAVVAGVYTNYTGLATFSSVVETGNASRPYSYEVANKDTTPNTGLVDFGYGPDLSAANPRARRFQYGYFIGITLKP